MRYFILPGIFIFILLSGCAMMPERQRFVYSANYGEVQKLVESEIRETGFANTAKLWPLCFAYSALKRYDRLFECCDRLEANIRSGDKSAIDLDEMVAKNRGWDRVEWASVRSRYASKGIVYQDVSLWPFLLRAQAWIDLGQYARAIEEAKKAYVMVPVDQNQKTVQIGVLRVIGLAYALNGDREKALQVAGRLERIDTSGVYILHKIEQNIGLARIYLALKDFEKALDVIQRDDGAAKRFVLGFFIGTQDLFKFQELPKDFMLNKCLMETGKVSEAKAGYDALLNLPQTRDNGEIYWMILFDCGRIAEKEGNLKNAVMFYRQAVDVIEQERASINTEASKIGFVGDKQSVYFRLVHCLCADGLYDLAFEYVERSKARALVDMLASKKDFAIKDGNKQVVQELLDNSIKTEAELRVQGESIDKSNLRSVEIKNRDKLIEQSPELASLVSVRSFSSGDIRSAIPGDETLVEYFYHGDTLFAFIVTQGSVKGVKLDSRGLSDDVIAFRNHMLNTPDQTRSITINEINPVSIADKSAEFRKLRDSGRSLYERIFKPLEPMIGTRNITIVPHGVLHYVPFNALITDKGYLLDAYAIRVLPSATVLQFLKTKRGGQMGELIVFGNPDLNDPKYDLPFAQSEALAITKDNPKAKVLLRKQASKTAVKKFSDQFRYIHFACHGIFNPDKPLESGLMLSGDGRDDGMLTVNELYDMRLNADLVTLSACETALGKVSNGDDVVGFTRGFLYAGASSIVSSLWQVDDEATSLLMQEFYKNLKSADKRTALYRAQLKIKETYNSHPFFWAAFQLTGSIE